MHKSSNARPLSPHLQIYKPQLTSVMSIIHRFTGICFIAALFLVCIWIYFLCQGEKSYYEFCNFLNYPIIKFFIYAILASCYYHLLNGIRYLIWSIGIGYELNRVYIGGWLVTFFVCALTIFTVYLI